MAEKFLLEMAETIKASIPGNNIQIEDQENKAVISGDMECGIKGINVSIECSTSTIKIKGAREYKYPITEASKDIFQQEMIKKYNGDYNIYASGQMLAFSKFFSYQTSNEAINITKNAIAAMQDMVEEFENKCVNFMEKTEDDSSENEEYNPEANVNIVNVDNNYHAVSMTEQDNQAYDDEHKSLQCSAIMIICAASTSLYSYITTDASRSSIFRGSAESHENVIKAKNSMVKSQSVNINALRDATEQARQNIGYVAYDDPDLHKHSATATPTTSNTYINAAYKLTQTKIAKIKEDKEEEYKKYEDTLGIQVFVRDKNGHYKYTKKGYAKLDDKYKIFNEEKMTTFMNMLLGGTNWLTMVFILVAKAGLIKKSNSICNVIVGV